MTTDETSVPSTRPSPSGGGCLLRVLGLLLVLVGIPMLVCPGPGIAAIAAGLGMLGVDVARKNRQEGGRDAHT